MGGKPWACAQLRPRQDNPACLTGKIGERQFSVGSGTGTAQTCAKQLRRGEGDYGAPFIKTCGVSFTVLIMS